MSKIKMPVTAGPTTPLGKSLRANKRRTIPKYIICLKCLLDRGDSGMIELEAFREYGETCLHSTISYLSNNLMISFKRTLEPHEHQHGGITRFMRYSLTRREQAIKLVSFYYSKGELCL